MPSDPADRRTVLVASQIDDLLAFYETGVGEPREMVRKMRMVVETYCMATYPAFFDSDDSLMSILTKIRETGEQHPACKLLDELDAIHSYSHEYDRTHATGSDEVEPLDAQELTEFGRRILKIVGAIPYLDN